jgi:hypothetical protein
MQIANLFVPGAIITIILGLLACFFGYKIKKFALFIIWFIIGYNLGLKVPSDWYMGNELITAILPFCIGLLLSLIGLTAEKICISLIAGVFAFFAAINFQGGVFTLQTTILAGIVAALAGCIAGFLVKPAFIILTAVIGAYYVGLNVVGMDIPHVTYVPFFYIITAVLAVLGMLYQFKKNKGLQ